MFTRWFQEPNETHNKNSKISYRPVVLLQVKEGPRGDSANGSGYLSAREKLFSKVDLEGLKRRRGIKLMFNVWVNGENLQLNRGFIPLRVAILPGKNLQNSANNVIKATKILNVANLIAKVAFFLKWGAILSTKSLYAWV